jgi:phage baseplate assembly protein V
VNFQQTADMQRRLANVVRVGVVASVDLPNARCRVTIGDLQTAPLPFITCKAGEDRTWHPPEVGEQVIVLAPSGELTAGFVLGGVYTTSHPAPSTSPEVAKMLFKDGSSATYDRALHTLTLDLPTSGSSLSVTVNGNVTLSATGNALVEADGNATVSAGAVARIEAGTQIQMVAPAVSITSTVTVSGDVVASGKSLVTHRHGGVAGGTGQTSTPV